MMTRDNVYDLLVSLGFTTGESDALRRISLTLQNRSFWSNPNTGRHYVAPAADRQRGALRRLDAIVTARNVRAGWVQNAGYYGGAPSAFPLSYYVQGDPRGAMLYILRPGDVPDGQDADSYYSRGIAIY